MRLTAASDSRGIGNVWRLFEVVVISCCLLAAVLTEARSSKKGGEGKNGMSVSRMRSLGEQAMVKGDSTKALQWFNKAVKAAPDDEKNYYKRFRVHIRKHNFKAALNDLAKAVQLKPDFSDAHSQRGKLQKKTVSLEVQNFVKDVLTPNFSALVTSHDRHNSCLI